MSDRHAEGGVNPSLHAASSRVDDYLGWLAGSGITVPDAADAGLGPIDALLIGLFLEFHPGRSTVIDLAAASTSGASAALCVQGGGVSSVQVVTEATIDGTLPSWRLALEGYVRHLGPGASAPLEAIEPTDRIVQKARRVALVALGGLDREEAGHRIDEALEQVPDGPLLGLGVGRFGYCGAVSALLERAEMRPGRRAVLFRELDHVLGGGLALLAPEGPATDSVLARISTFFASNFDFLRLVEAHCRTAVAVTQLDEPTRSLLRPATARGGIEVNRLVALYRDACREREQLRANVADLLGRIWSQDQEAADLRRRMAEIEADRVDAHARLGAVLDEVSGRLSTRARHALFPAGSIREWGYLKGRSLVGGLRRGRAAG